MPTLQSVLTETYCASRLYGIVSITIKLVSVYSILALTDVSAEEVG